MIKIFSKKSEPKRLKSHEVAAIQASVMGKKEEVVRIARKKDDAMKTIHTSLASMPELLDVIIAGHHKHQVTLNKDNTIYAIFDSKDTKAKDKFLAAMPTDVPIECLDFHDTYDRMDDLDGAYSVKKKRNIAGAAMSAPETVIETVTEKAEPTHKLITYKLNKTKAVEKVKFVYALKGRGNSPGIIKELDGQAVGKGVLVMPQEKMGELEGFFKEWDVTYEGMDISLH